MTTDVLIAHSNDLDRTALSRAIRSEESVRAKMVVSGREAINSLKRGQFEAVVCQEHLEDIDAWRLIRMVRSGSFCPSATPVIVICETPTEELQPLADTHTYLIDPVSPTDVGPKVLSILQSRNKHSVLLVEDDRQSSDVLSSSLSRFYDVECAYDGEQAVTMWRSTQPDLVILDLMLPRVDGGEVLRTIQDESPSQQIIVLTAFDSPDKHQELMLAGAAEFLGKPVDVHNLLEVCDRILKHSMVMANVERHGESRRVVTSRLYAANYSLERGRTQSAASHLKAALLSKSINPLTDDEWSELLTEFDQRE